ncbi:MAG: galactokinase [Candidatus Hydrogenedentes bacterium]|nr:galactokinase [Candidatus Hydrogenedentota bacterium]
MQTLDTMAKVFREMFGPGATPFACRAPARVNLLGEHLDYNGLPVLPMTMNRETWCIARATAGNTIRIRNGAAGFAPEDFNNVSPLTPSEAGNWINYCKAAIEGLNQRFGIERGPGLDLLVAGNIPAAAGLSSSSALVVVTALAYLRALGQKLDASIQRIELAGVLAQAERYVGVQGGGMDQAIILLGDDESACKIDFFPLRIERVPLFDQRVFVVCNSMVVADKSGAAVQRYNEGPASSRLIRALVEKYAQINFGEEVKIERLGDLWFGPLCLTNAEVESLFREAFPRPKTSLAEMVSLLDIDEPEIRRRWLQDLPEPGGGFPLQGRARHQLSEHARVEQGRDCMIAGDADGFGALMDDSHRSCADDYRVSCPELDALVAIGRKAGSKGSRLTGAGFGGSTVHLVAESDAEDFVATVKRGYYKEFLGRTGSNPIEQDWIIIAKPSASAGYLGL